MIYLPSSRRFFLSALILLALILIWRSTSRVPSSISALVVHQPSPPSEGAHIPIDKLRLDSQFTIKNVSLNHQSPPSQYYYDFSKESDDKKINRTNKDLLWSKPILNPHIEVLWQCSATANRYTNHIRLPNIIQNISQISPNPLYTETRAFWNPTIIALPYWSVNQYLVVSRIVTDGNHQENVLCEANICYVGQDDGTHKGERVCTAEDLPHVGPAGGLRCASPPIRLSVPPTPAADCQGKFRSYVDIPGFHDPRIFYSGKGEPLMMVNTQSQYACFGLWLIDLRSLYEPLAQTLSSSPKKLSLGPLRSYHTLTELTRNPPETRAQIEKNWMFFYPESGESFIHYDISNPKNQSRGRTFAKVIGGGLTTVNLTDPFELSCINDVGLDEPDEVKRGGTWHQATNSLRLVLCNRGDKACQSNEFNNVFFTIVHRKHPNYLKLPLRYERYFMVWAATPPYSMLGLSQHPILMANETASGWFMDENWDDDAENAAKMAEHKAMFGSESHDPHGGKEYWAYFTYTVSIAWAWGREVEVEEMNVGYLDDEVVLAIGIDDKGQGMARVKAADLLQCLRACPGRSS